MEEKVNIKDLKNFRKNAGYSQKALAEEAGIQPATLSRLESGITQKPRKAILLRLGKALGVIVTSALIGAGTLVETVTLADLRAALAIFESRYKEGDLVDTKKFFLLVKVIKDVAILIAGLFYLTKYMYGA
jgi:transcriptional regulator with XRE-family HTH domain